MNLEEQLSEKEIHTSLRRRKNSHRISALAGLLGTSWLFFDAERHLYRQFLSYGNDSSSFFDHERLPLHLATFLLPASLGFITYALFRTAFLLPSLDMAVRGFRLALKEEFNSLSPSDQARKAEHYARGIAKTKDPVQRQRLHLHHTFLSGNTEQAFRQAVALLTHLDRFRYRPSFFERLYQRFLNYRLMQVQEIRRNPSPQLEVGFMYLEQGFPPLAKRRFRSAAALPHPSQPHYNCFFAYALGSLQQLEQGEKKRQKLSRETQQQWLHTVKLILEDPSLVQRFRRLGESRHEVLEVSGEGVLRDTFIFKRDSTPESLRREHTLEQDLRSVFQSDLVVEPLAFLEHSGHHYLVLRRIAGKSLRDAGKQEGWLPLLSNVVPSVVSFHATTKEAYDQGRLSNLLPRDYHRFLREKALGRLRQKPYPSLEQAAAHLSSTLEHYPRYPVHSDLHPENIFVSDIGFTFLDPEYMCLATRESDYADLLEHHTVPITESERSSLLNAFYEQQTPRQSQEAFMQTYSRSAVSRTFYMYSSLDASSYGMDTTLRQQAQAHYAQRTLVNLHRIKEISPSDFQQLEALVAVVDH